MEFELLPNRTLRYANNSNYKNDVMIRKEGILYNAVVILSSLRSTLTSVVVPAVVVSQIVIDEIKRIITDSEITKEDDHSWPAPDRVGRQELEVKMGSEHIHFTVR